ncbi:SDR family NAD(P)-dependent oxidoreductase [Corallococcus sp. Z5C101001]|nr:SDR family NAD(P)-dependent oxidoreductase [Corallococcus sp. Z5C101001]
MMPPNAPSPLLKAYLAIEELEARLAAVEQARREPIALVGIGCRFPGGAVDPDSFWELLRDGRDATSEVPADRWRIDDYFDADPEAPGKMYTRRGAFLDRVDAFDAAFFGISPREAASMDPQQRLLLEVAWEALEHAGIAPDRLSGSRTGVYVGLMATDYTRLQAQQVAADALDPYGGTGTELSFPAGRLSYHLGLQGPSMVVATACSSSLVSVHLACQALRARECDLALAGGVNLMLSPDISLLLSRMRALSADGRCRTFDAAADGYGRGEGCGVVVLKRLSDAVAGRDPILAVLRGSAVNHDGRSAGLTVPSGPAQERVLRQALEAAGLGPTEVDYVEAHGTGTSLGDPIEVRVLADVLCPGRDASQPLLLGSVKTNLGHLEAAAGIAGLIKVVLSLRHGELPAHLHLTRPNPHIPWDTLPLRIPVKHTVWPRQDRPRTAAVASFGMSGINAHVLVEEAPAALRMAPAPEQPYHLLTLSAHAEDALRQLAGRYARHLPLSGHSLGAVASTTRSGRAHLPQRLALVAASPEEASRKLAEAAEGTLPPGARARRASSAERPKIAFLFTGQGSQYPGMGRQLYETQPTFRNALERCAGLLEGQLERPLLDVLFPADGARGLLDDTRFTQPALFAFEYALAELWRSWGVVPSAVLGHSVGEYAAACVAGVFSLEDGLRLIAGRARLMGELPRDGEMLSVQASLEELAPRLARHAHAVSIAAVNGPRSVVVSGPREVVRALAEQWEAEGVRTRRLEVSHAFHSPGQDPILRDLQQLAAQVSLSAPRLRLVSNLTGALASQELTSPAYWARHAREAVQFAAGVRTLHQQGCRVFVELGPAPVLSGLGAGCLDDASAAWLPSLNPKRPDWQQLLESVAELYVRGAPLDWAGFEQDPARHRVALPTYPFQRQHYWLSPSVGSTHGTPAASAEPSSQVVRSLEQGDVARLSRMVEEAQVLTPEERGLLPRVLAALVERHREQRSEPPFQDWLYEVRWNLQALQGTTPPPDFLPSVEALRAQLDPRVSTLLGLPEIAPYESGLRELESLSATFILEALRRMSWQPLAGAPRSAGALAEQLGVIPSQRRLFERLLDILVEEGTLHRSADGWEVRSLPARPDARGQLEATASRHPSVRAELDLLERCGTRLAEVLQGRVDPLHLLFPGGDSRQLAALYRKTPASRTIHALVQDALSAVLERLPRQRKLRILEVGGGTGATTSYVLPLLPADRAEYTFTDLSPLLTARAAEEFAAYPFVRYQALDLEKDPASQGLAAGAYDLVLASNVLHATRDLRESLRHVRTLLSPGGLLVALEATEPTRWIDLTFGLTGGWNGFVDTDLRTRHPLLSAEQWRGVLRECGFSEAAALPLEHEGLAVLSRQAALLARADARVDTAVTSKPRRRWLLLVDAGPLGEALAARLRRQGDACLFAHPGERFEQLAPDAFRVDPSNPADLRRLVEFAQAAPTGDTAPMQLGGVVQLWSLGAAPAEALDEALLEAAALRSYAGTLHLVQALARTPIATPPALWLVTRGAVPVGPRPDVPGLAQSPLWALGRAIALEHPELRCTRVDLKPGEHPPEEEAQALLEEFTSGQEEDQVACRAEGRFVSRLARHSLAPAAAVRFRDDATYLITGGLGGLGRRVARWMVERGARHLVLVGRRATGPEADAVVAELALAGAQARILQADISREEEVRRVLEHIRAHLPALRGVMHAAGVLDNGLLSQLTWERFSQVLAPKVRGAWHLHTLTRGLPLDCFVLFSASAALLANPSQGNHGAANTFLDMLAWHRRAQGLPALSINWGGWAEIGAAASAEAVELLRKKGLGMIAPEQGLAALERLFSSPVPQVGVVPVDWARFLDGAGRLPLVRDFAGMAPPPVAATVGILDKLQSAPPHRRRALLGEHVRGQLAHVLRLDGSRPVDADQGFFELGMDSLTSLELRNRLQGSLRLSLPATLTLDYPTLDTLTGFLASQLGTPESVPVSGERREETAAPDPVPGLEVEALSEEEAEARLLKQLETLRF